jgi:hypothetical protein
MREMRVDRKHCENVATRCLFYLTLACFQFVPLFLALSLYRRVGESSLLVGLVFIILV